MSNTATLHTSLGDIVIELFPNHAPKTVENFVGLATGAKEWTDPRTGKKSNENLYDGTIFPPRHRWLHAARWRPTWSRLWRTWIPVR